MAIPRLGEIVSEKYRTVTAAADAMGVNKGNLSNMINNGNPKTIRIESIERIQKAFPEFNIDWILEKSPIKSKSDLNKPIRVQQNIAPVENAKVIGNVTEDLETKFTEISPGRYRMRIQLVTEAAKAGYLQGFADSEYVEELEYHETIVEKYYKGKYMAFQISGDSMFDGSHESILDKSVVIGRMIKQELWNSRLHSHQWPNWIIVHKTEGIVCKQIASQDLEKGTLVLSSLNPDKNQYPDFEINLDDVYQIFNVIKVERTY